MECYCKNMSYSYSEASMGYHEQEKSDFHGICIRGRDGPHLTTYFESHDEERIMYKNLTWGSANII